MQKNGVKRVRKSVKYVLYELLITIYVEKNSITAKMNGKKKEKVDKLALVKISCGM